MEIIDIVNMDDEVIGTATREDAHKNPELIHRAVHFTLIDYDNNKILLTQRSFKKSHDAGKYCFLGEHLVTGESYQEAVVRGIQEELGIPAMNTVELAKEIFRYDYQTEFVRFYVATSDVEVFHYDQNEMEGVQWITLDELTESDLDISDMTRKWIDTVDWKGLLSKNPQ